MKAGTRTRGDGRSKIKLYGVPYDGRSLYLSPGCDTLVFKAGDWGVYYSHTGRWVSLP